MIETSAVLKALESESIEIIRETAAAFKRPVMLYSIGKDSSVLLHLARKAFHPARIPFKILHVDTGWKFREMIEFRDKTARELVGKFVAYAASLGGGFRGGPIFPAIALGAVLATCAHLIVDGTSISALAVARHLRGRRDLTVATNNLRLVSEIVVPWKSSTASLPSRALRTMVS